MDDTPSITRTRHTALAPFRATAAQVRAGGIGALATLVAVLFRRPDLLVLATPLLVVATWGLATRPSEPVAVHTRLGRSTLAEGEATRWTLEADAPPGCDLVAVRLVEAEQLQIEPRRGFLMAATPPGAGSVTITCDVRAMRWGVHAVGPAIVTMLSPWGAFRIPPAQLLPHALTALPGQTPFDLRGPTPHPHGLIGVHRSRRTGSGTEFDMIRAFHPGDRLRRIHWPSSTRTGHLHVSSTFTDNDSSVVLLLDGFSDLGPVEGISGRPTSLDLTVRAAAAIAEHYLYAGDRVSVRVVGAHGIPRLKAGSGPEHIRRLLEVMARIRPASERSDTGRAALMALGSPSLVVVLSPLIDTTMVDIVATLGARGLTTVVVDTCPPHLTQAEALTQRTPGEPAGPVETALMWRVRLLARRGDISALRAHGIPVVPWLGPGSLDAVLRDVARRARAPRMARR